MRCARRTLAILALTTSTLMSCTGNVTPANTPTIETQNLRLYTTSATSPLTMQLTTSYADVTPSLTVDTRTGNYRATRERFENAETPYFITNHLPVDSPLWAAPIGQDGIAIITHPDTPLENITLDQLRDIYRGRITQWQAIDAKIDSVITVISREDGSATRSEFERMVMGQATTTSNARVAPSSQSMIETVIATPGSIGYVSMGYLNATRMTDRVNLLAIGETLPTPQTVADNIYPLRSTLFVVGNVEPEDTYRAFVGWMQGPAGQVIIGQNYAPLRP